MWRAGPADPQVALVHRPRYDDWAFPKGKAVPGEHPLITAVREVMEETGVRPVLGRPLGRTTYLASGRPKRVDYWAATPAPSWGEGPAGGPRRASPPGHRGLNGGAGSRARAGFGSPGETGFVPNDEVDKLEWLPVEAAARRLSYEHDVRLLREFASAPAPTRPFIFLRHASAEDKEGWRESSLLRPLDEMGRADAWALAGLLLSFGPVRVFSSAAARCVETVLPYSVHAGVPVAAEPVFAVDSAAEGQPGSPTPADAAARLAELLADGAPMIFCGHRENLPSLHAQAVQHFGAQPPAELALAKGSFRVLHVAAGSSATRLIATEQHDIAPPP